jgi:hypothetical protein
MPWLFARVVRYRKPSSRLMTPQMPRPLQSNNEGLQNGDSLMKNAINYSYRIMFESLI